MAISWIRRLAVAAIIGAVGLMPLGVRAADAPAAGKSLSLQNVQKAAALSETIVAGEDDASLQAVKDLQAMGDAARLRLVVAVRERLARDKGVIENSIRRIGDGAKAKALQDEIATTRKAAVANIAKLAHDETIRTAHENYDKLARLQPLFNEVCSTREAIAASMARRDELMRLAGNRRLAPDNRFSPENEAKLKASAEGVLGMSVAQMREIPELGKGKEPADPMLWNLWFYRACRRIEAYNQSVQSMADPEEFENVRLLNAYRESLGTMPLEMDARLFQSARRHSKEMVDKNYFAHESPTPSEKSHGQRMKNAGYAGGYSENIAAGSTTGKGVFWMWFDSPGHHQNMVHAGSVGIGVGRWGKYCTQNFGTGKRLMLMDEAERAKQTVLGTVLPPQGSR